MTELNNKVVFYANFKQKLPNLWKDIPKILRRDIIMKYLDFITIRRLDTATCCSKLRGELLHQYKRMICYGVNTYKFETIRDFRWCMKRQFNIMNFTLELKDHAWDSTWPTFHYICSKEEHRDVALLMAKQCNDHNGNSVVNSVDPGTKFTALHYAVKAGNLTMTKMLIIDGNADVNQKNGGGYTPLLVLCVGGLLELDSSKIDVAMFLCENGADLEIRQGTNQWTPLHWCCHLGNVQMATLLVHHGADITARSAHDRSCYQIAKHAIGKNRESIVLFVELCLVKRGLKLE
jgi:hypothetical protein